MTHAEIYHSSASEDNIMEHNHLKLETFEYTDHNSQDLEHEIDPDNNFFSSIMNYYNYFTTEQFNRSISMDRKLTIIHFNSRSLYANFSHIKSYLQLFSTTFSCNRNFWNWFNTDKGMNFKIEGYELRFMSRKNKSGGGVALYVNKYLKFRVLYSITTVVDNVLQCVTVEMCKEKK